MCECFEYDPGDGYGTRLDLCECCTGLWKDAQKRAQEEQPKLIEDWHEDVGPALFFDLPIEEAPYCGTPLDSDWPWSKNAILYWVPLPEFFTRKELEL